MNLFTCNNTPRHLILPIQIPIGAGEYPGLFFYRRRGFKRLKKENHQHIFLPRVSQNLAPATGSIRGVLTPNPPMDTTLYRRMYTYF